MKYLSILAALFLATNVNAIVEIGEPAPNLCYKQINTENVCLDDLKGNVVVLIYNAGWCAPCNTKMIELAPATIEFAQKPVVFVSLSAEGWERMTYPDATFLGEWKEKHNIPEDGQQGISFTVASSFGDFGKNFIADPRIPNLVVLDKEGIVQAAKIGMTVTESFELIHKLLGHPIIILGEAE